MIHFLSNSTGKNEKRKQLITDIRGSEPNFLFVLFFTLYFLFIKLYLDRDLKYL